MTANKRKIDLTEKAYDAMDRCSGIRPLDLKTSANN